MGHTVDAILVYVKTKELRYILADITFKIDSVFLILNFEIFMLATAQKLINRIQELLAAFLDTR